MAARVRYRVRGQRTGQVQRPRQQQGRSAAASFSPGTAHLASAASRGALRVCACIATLTTRAAMDTRPAPRGRDGAARRRVDWASTLQSTVATTCEAEYQAAGVVVRVAQWLRKLLVDLQLDSQGHLAREGAPLLPIGRLRQPGRHRAALQPQSTRRSKHIDIVCTTSRGARYHRRGRLQVLSLVRTMCDAISLLGAVVRSSAPAAWGWMGVL
jgi:hypothetical protein